MQMREDEYPVEGYMQIAGEAALAMHKKQHSD